VRPFSVPIVVPIAALIQQTCGSITDQ
jgi:hypothetical protein